MIAIDKLNVCLSSATVASINYIANYIVHFYLIMCFTSFQLLKPVHLMISSVKETGLVSPSAGSAMESRIVMMARMKTKGSAVSVLYHCRVISKFGPFIKERIVSLHRTIKSDNLRRMVHL